MAVRTSEDSIVFACYSRACAPPPTGRGGSVRGGRKGGSVIRKSGGGDSSTTKSVARAGAKALSARFGTKRRGAADKGNTSSTVKKADKNRPGGVGGSSVGRSASVSRARAAIKADKPKITAANKRKAALDKAKRKGAFA